MLSLAPHGYAATTSARGALGALKGRVSQRSSRAIRYSGRPLPPRAAGFGTPRPLPPDPPNLLVRDEKLTATAVDRGHLALPDGLRKLDRANAELGGGVGEAQRRGRHVGVGRRLDRLQLLRARRATPVHIAEVVGILALVDSRKATGFLGRDSPRGVTWHRTHVRAS